jgi:cellulose biosynthesis protein BcsQ
VAEAPGSTASSTPPPLGRIVTFYSYKGGTGRSMALANTAWVLAASGYRVAVIDWDLEAPGLHRYLRPYLRDSTLEASDGVIDFVIAFADAARPTEGSPPPSTSTATSGGNWFDKLADLRMYARAVAWDGFPAPGRIDFIPAGRQDAGYSVRVNSFNWQHFYTKLGGGIFLEETKRRLRAEYDYVLIDSRTGVSDTSGVCTVQMPDTLVVCFTLNEQSMHGASSTAASAREQRRLPDGRSGLRVLPVPMRVDVSEKERVDAAREVARERFDPFLDWLDDEQLEDYWGDVEMPYVPFYSLEEVLAVFDRPRSRGSVLAALGGIVSWLTSKEITSLPSYEADVRERELARFMRPVKRNTRPRGEGRYVFYVSYSGGDRDAAMDRFLAEVTAEVRVQLGLSDSITFYDRQAIQAGAEWAPEIARALESNTVALVLMSPGYFRSEAKSKELAALRKAGANVLPVVWVPIEPAMVPHWLSEAQWFRAGGRGLRYLASVDQGREYRESLYELASRIASLQQRGKVEAPATSRSFEAVADGTASPVVVTVVAERKDVMRVARPEAKNYALRRQDWVPFPAEGAGLTSGQIVREAAMEANVAVHITSLHGFDRWLRRKPKSRASLALIDPWTIKRDEYRDRLLKWRQEQVPQTLIACVDGKVALQALADSGMSPHDVAVAESLDELRVQLRHQLTALKDAAIRQGPDLSRVFESEPPPVGGPLENA